MTINTHSVFNNHPVEVKEQFDKLNKLQQLRQLSRINRLKIIAFKPFAVKFHRIHWETLNEEDDSILVTLDGGATLSVSYATMTIAE